MGKRDYNKIDFSRADKNTVLAALGSGELTPENEARAYARLEALKSDQVKRIEADLKKSEKDRMRDFIDSVQLKLMDRVTGVLDNKTLEGLVRAKSILAKVKDKDGKEKEKESFTAISKRFNVRVDRNTIKHVGLFVVVDDKVPKRTLEQIAKDLVWQEQQRREAEKRQAMIEAAFKV